METIREVFYNVIFSDNDVKQDRFIKTAKEFLKTHIEIKLPMQLFEEVFNFNFHRGVKHPISSNIVNKFKSNGLKVSKVRNKYLVRIKKQK